MIPFCDHHVLSTMWNNGVDGKNCDGIDIILCLRVMPVAGSGQSKVRFAASSHVEPVHILDEMAARHATRVEYFALCEYVKMDLKGGTKHSLDPSGKSFWTHTI